MDKTFIYMVEITTVENHGHNGDDVDTFKSFYKKEDDAIKVLDDKVQEICKDYGISLTEDDTNVNYYIPGDSCEITIPGEVYISGSIEVVELH